MYRFQFLKTVSSRNGYIRTSWQSGLEKPLDCEETDDTVAKDGRFVRFTAATGESVPLHSLWLRHNCPCGMCLHEDSGQRLVSIADVPLETTARVVSISAQLLSITWCDGHQSSYGTGWLKTHLGAARQQRRHQPILWDNATEQIDSAFDFETVVSSDEERFLLLRRLMDYGFVVGSACAEPRTSDRAAGPTRQHHPRDTAWSNQRCRESAEGAQPGVQQH